MSITTLNRDGQIDRALCSTRESGVLGTDLCRMSGADSRCVSSIGFRAVLELSSSVGANGCSQFLSVSLTRSAAIGEQPTRPPRLAIPTDYRKQSSLLLFSG
jgi:hypothetical protein